MSTNYYVTFDPKKPCDPSKKNGYTRYELDLLANENAIKDHHKMEMKDICETLQEMKNPFAAKIFPDFTEDKSEKGGIKKELELFLREFKDDLVKWWHWSTPSLRAVISGGFGARKLLETKYNVYDKIVTKDIDITVSIRDAWFSPNQVIKHIENRLKVLQDNISRRRGSFNKTLDPNEGLHWSFFKFDDKHEYSQYFQMHRFGIFVVTLDNDDFADIMICDAPIYSTILDKEASENAEPIEMPIKNVEYMLREFLTLIYIENTASAKDYAYSIRNPVVGKFKEKGLKDLERARILCRESKEERYKKYCELLANYTVDRMNAMPQEQRDAYFEDLKKALYIHPEVSDSALGNPKKMDPQTYYDLHPDEV